MILKQTIFVILLIASFTLMSVIGDKNDSAACHQPKATGPCRSKLLRFAYDGKSGHCISFYYSGCGATKNNFLTYEECRRDCMKQLRY